MRTNEAPNIGNYRYNPEDFRGMLNLTGELQVFYKLLENYRNDSSDDNWFDLRKHWEDLFFTIKHREVEGFLNPVVADDIRGYLEELVNA